MKLGILCVFITISTIVISSFTIGLAGDTGIVIGGFALSIGFFGLGRISHAKPNKN